MPKFNKGKGFKMPASGKTMQDRQLNFGSKEEASPGTPLYRKKLDGGIKAEANNDGTMYIDESVIPDSKEERKILAHEMKHMTDMKIGKLRYDDNYVKWNGKEFPRIAGRILYNGEWIPEGGKDFPWEQL